jgi:ABC-type uncharacterized transport system permease subunit
MSKNIPIGVIAAALFNFAMALLYAAAGFTHPRDLWLAAISLTFTATGLLGVAVGLKLRELGTRLSALERELSTRPRAQHA